MRVRIGEPFAGNDALGDGTVIVVVFGETLTEFPQHADAQKKGREQQQQKSR
jgi:hypothetical protein